MNTTTAPPATASRPATGARIARDSRIGRRGAKQRPVIASAVLILGALYCLVPVLWVVIASTKSNTELFTTFTFIPGTSLLDNLGDLFAYGGGQFGMWAYNSAIYAIGGAVLSTLVSTMAGYALAKYDFPGRQIWFYAILAGVLLPGITLAIPQYLLMSQMGLAGTYWSVLLPSLISPFGIFLARVYASSAVPSETIEAARIDGANDYRIFTSIALPMMVPGMVTIFLLQFVGIWNNFLLPFIMLSNQDLYPITLGLYSFLSRGAGDSDLYPLVIMGSAVSVIPLIVLVMILQRFWRADLLAGGLKG